MVGMVVVRRECAGRVEFVRHGWSRERGTKFHEAPNEITCPCPDTFKLALGLGKDGADLC